MESPTGIRQEVLPEINIEELLSLGYDSNWETSDGTLDREDPILTLMVYVNDERSSSLLNGTPEVEVVIKDISSDTEIGREKMQLTETSELFKEAKEGLAAISFSKDLSKYTNKEGSYAVWLEMKTEGNIFYHGEIATFDYDGKRSSGRGSGTGTLYPIW